jgi:uncharacterized protein (PEP-CTERM system associated)
VQKRLLTTSWWVLITLRQFDGVGGSSSDSVSPYLEGALNYRVGKDTTLRWFHYLGYDESDLGGSGESYSYRTGLSASHRFNDRLTGNVDLHYIHFTSDGISNINELSEDTVSLSLGFDYRLWKKVSLTGSYSYTNVSSDESFREYDRQRMSIGVSAQF